MKKASDSIKVLKLNVSSLWFDRKKNLEKSPIAKGDQNEEEMENLKENKKNHTGRKNELVG